MTRLKTKVGRDEFERKLRRSSVWGCPLGIALYLLLLRIGGSGGKPLLGLVFAGLAFGLIGIITGRLLISALYDPKD